MRQWKHHNLMHGNKTMGTRFGAVSALPRGTAFSRFVKALAANRGDRQRAASYADQWRDTPEVAELLRAPVPVNTAAMIDVHLRTSVNVGTTSDSNYADALVQYQIMLADWIQELRTRTI